MEHDFKFYCNQCKTPFLFKITEEPTQVVCPNGHKLGVWSYGKQEERHCKFCENRPLIAISHLRKRHDLLSPKGLPIIVEDPRDVEKSLSHFATFHPHILEKAKKAVFGGKTALSTTQEKKELKSLNPDFSL